MTNPLGLTQITRGLVPPIESVLVYLVIVLTLLFILTLMLLAGVENLRGSLQLIGLIGWLVCRCSAQPH